jgi:ATP-dependent Clp protease protease subunit
MNNRKLLQLLANNEGKGKPLNVAMSEDGSEASVYVYDAIDAYWGVSAKAFADALNGIKAPVIHLRINSPGGDVFEARAMKTALQEHPSRIVAHIDGLAASAASFLMLGADEIKAAPGSFVMIHNAWSFVVGNAESMRHQAKLLDKVDDTIMRDYTAKTGQTQRQIKEWMGAETWFTAQEALDAKFIDGIAEKPAKATANAALFNLSAYQNAPKNYGAELPADDPDKAESDEIDDATLTAEAEAGREACLARLALYERTAP